MRLLLLAVKIISALSLVALPTVVLIRTWKFRVCRTKVEHRIIRGMLIAWAAIGMTGSLLLCAAPLKSFLRHKKLDSLTVANKELIKRNSEIEKELIYEGNKYDKLLKTKKLYLYDGTIISLRRSSGRETVIFKRMLSLRKKKQFKELAYACDVQIKRTSDWLTPYLFQGIASIELGQTNKAIESLHHVCDNAPFDPSYSQAHHLLNQITSTNEPISPPALMTNGSTSKH